MCLEGYDKNKSKKNPGMTHQMTNSFTGLRSHASSVHSMSVLQRRDFFCMGKLMIVSVHLLVLYPLFSSIHSFCAFIPKATTLSNDTILGYTFNVRPLNPTHVDPLFPGSHYCEVICLCKGGTRSAGPDSTFDASKILTSR